MNLKFALLVVLSGFLTGCPVMLYSALHNESDEAIWVVENSVKTEIGPGETGRIVWNQDCILIQTQERLEKFAPHFPANEAISPGIFSSSFESSYKGRGELWIPIENSKQKRLSLSECGA